MAAKPKRAPAKGAKPKPAKSAKRKPEKTVAKVKPVAKAKTRISLIDRLASTTIPDDAWRLARVPPKVAASERAAAILALGYPHVLLTTDEPVRDFPDGIAFAKHYDRRVVPAAALPTLLAVALGNTDDDKRAAVRKPAKLDLPKALDWVLRYQYPGEVWLLEAMAGSDVFAEAMVAALVDTAPKEWAKFERTGYATVRSLGPILWRVPPETRGRLRGALADKLAELTARGGLSRAGKALDVILNGRAGVERSSTRHQDRIHLSDLVYAGDDPEWVSELVRARLATMRPADREAFSIQYAMLGGPTLIALMREDIARFRKDDRTHIEEQLSLCA